MPTDAPGSAEPVEKPSAPWYEHVVPRSLQRQFGLVFAALALLIVAGSGVSLYAVRTLTLAARQLAEERLERVQLAQNLAAETSALSLAAYQLLAAVSIDEVQAVYVRMLKRLEACDELVARLSLSSGDVAVLDLHQASQLLRNTANVAVQLREEMLRPQGQPQPVPHDRLQLLDGLRDEMHRQSNTMADVAAALSAGSRSEYRNAVQALVDESTDRQRWILSFFMASLLLAALIARVFLGRHVVGRLLQVSHHMRIDPLADDPGQVPVTGRDEIGEMARALDRFLQDRRQLARTRASLETEQQRLAAIIDHTADGIIVLQGDRLQQLNPAGEQMFGWHSDAIRGQPVERVLADFEPPLGASTGTPRSARGRRRDGRRFRWRCR